MENNLFDQGIDLMLFGMGTVFVFLTVLVIATMIMSHLVHNYFAEPEPVLAPKPTLKESGSATVDAKTLKVIQEAIHMHRAKKR